MATPDSRLLRAIRSITSNSSIISKLDVRAALALFMTLAILAMAWSRIEIPGELWVAYGAIIGYFFPRPSETTK